MKLSEMEGSFPLTAEGIDNNVALTAPGVYALGIRRKDSGGTFRFHLKYVGRSDSDVNDRLHRHIGKRPRFRFQYCATEEEAFEAECRLYHNHQDNIDNANHPDQPDFTDLECPVCGIYD